MSSEVRLVVVTYASDGRHPGLIKLGRTLRAWGHEFRPIVGDWRGFASKLTGVHAQLPKLAAEGFTHLLFTDAYDTVCVGPPAAVLPHCTDRMLVSCEKACWPDPSLMDKYPPGPRSPWCHVNSGGYVGPIPLIYDALMNASGDDQLWLTRKYLAQTDGRIIRDDNCELFQTTGHTVVPWETWDKNFAKLGGGRIRNTRTGTSPCLIHGNGLADMGWLDDVLRLSDGGVLEPTTIFAPPSPPPVQPGPRVTTPEKPFTYHDIPGFGTHDFATFYERLVEECPAGGTIVEVGCYHGRSLAQLAICADAANKDIRVVGVDHCKDQSEQLGDTLIANLNKCGINALHIRNTKSIGVCRPTDLPAVGTVTFYEMSSVEAAENFLSGSAWCVFLDDGHLHEEIAAGVDAWMPRVAEGGILAGHDAKWFTVWEPLKAKLPRVVHDPLWPDCWFSLKDTPLTGVDIHASVRVPFEHGDAVFGYGVGKFRSDKLPSGSPLTAFNELSLPHDAEE